MNYERAPNGFIGKISKRKSRRSRITASRVLFKLDKKNKKIKLCMIIYEIEELTTDDAKTKK